MKHNVVDALIEIPLGSKNKYELDEKTGHIKLDRVLYAAMILLFLHPDIPESIATIILTVCGLTMLCSMFLYGRFFHHFIKHTENQEQIAAENTNEG